MTEEKRKRVTQVTLTVVTDLSDEQLREAAEEMVGRALPGTRDVQVWEVKVIPAARAVPVGASLSLAPIPGLVGKHHPDDCDCDACEP